MFYDLKKTACSAKFLFGSYERRTVSGNAKNTIFSTLELFFDLICSFWRKWKWLQSIWQIKNYMHTNFQINTTIIHLSITGKPLKFQNQAYIDAIKTVKAFWKMCFLDFDVKNIPIACLIPIFRSPSDPLKDLWSNICRFFAKNRKFWSFDRIFLKNGWSDFFKILVTCSPYVILLPQKNCIFKSNLILEIYGLERKKRCEK